MIELPFRKVLTERYGLIYEPTIQVTLKGPNGSVDVAMIIDSGADISIIPYTLGEDLGLHLDMEKRRDVRGVGDSSVAYILSTVEVQIGDLNVEARVGWALTDDVPLILGRLDIFRSFVIEFRELEGKIIFRRAKARGKKRP